MSPPRPTCGAYPVLFVANGAALICHETFFYSISASKNSSLAVHNVESNVNLVVIVDLAPAIALQ